MRAGRQFLRLGCVFDEDALRFLPRTIDDLFARRALLSRLSTEQPAGCVAEEVIAVSLINEARAWLELEADSGEFSARTAAGAIDVLPDLFALFEDDDVLRMFDMREPADAVIDGVSDAALWLGVADQRLEAWFIPFGESLQPATWTTGRSRRRPRRRSRGRSAVTLAVLHGN